MRQFVIPILFVIAVLMLSATAVPVSAVVETSPFKHQNREKLYMKDIYWDNSARDLLVVIMVRPSIIQADENAGLVVETTLTIDFKTVQKSKDWVNRVKLQYEGSIAGAKPNGGFELTDRYGEDTIGSILPGWHVIKIEMQLSNQNGRTLDMSSFSEILYIPPSDDDDRPDEEDDRRTSN